MENKQKLLDSLGGKKARCFDFDYLSASYVNKCKKKSIWFSKKGAVDCFYTSNSKLYYTPEEYKKILKGEKLGRVSGALDSAVSRNGLRVSLASHVKIIREKRIFEVGQEDKIYENIKERYQNLRNYLSDSINRSVQGVSVGRMWNISVVGAVIFGMMLMTMMYRYLGESVSAKIEGKGKNKVVAEEGAVLGTEDANDEIDAEFMTKLLSDYEKYENIDEAKLEMEKTMTEMLKGYPMEKMVPYIIKKDKIVAAFLVAIARKESGWGKHVPVLKGEDCYNYWGYKGIRKRMGTGGHTCFDSPEDAVNTVAKRIEFLVSNEKLNTPAKMVVWKCGYDCSWDSKTAIKKWISDVDLYFKKLNK